METGSERRSRLFKGELQLTELERCEFNRGDATEPP